MGFLRFWLALCVIRQHVAESSMPLHLFMPAGPVAVQCFYVISGFYMALVLDRKYVRSPWVFYFNRVMRLYPAFVVLSLLAIGVAWWDRWAWGYTNGLYGGFESAWPHLGLGARAITVVTNLFIEGKDVTSFLAVDPRTAQYYFTAHWKQQAFPGVNLQVLPQAWSLGLEFSFYLLSPWLLRLRSRWLLALVALSLALRVLLSLCGLDQDPWNYRFFPSELALFLGGALAYRIYQRLPETDTGWRRASYLATCAFIPALVFGPVFAGGDGPLAMVLVPLLSLALPWIFDRTKDLAWDRSVGELSYTMYLGHLLVVDLYAGFDFGWAHWGRFPVLVMALTIALAWLIRQAVEKPADRWRARLTHRWLGVSR